MFAVAEISDAVKIPPDLLQGTLSKTVLSRLAAKYPNRVIREVGLCLTIKEILEIGAPLVQIGGGGAAFVKVRFDVLAFQPQVGCVMEATVLKADLSGVRASVGFFNSIFISGKDMQAGSNWRRETESWDWDMQGEGKLKVRVDSKISFKVLEVNYAVNTSEPVAGDVATLEELVSSEPMWVRGSMYGSGLGCTEWWEAAEEGDDDDDDDEEDDDDEDAEEDDDGE